MITGLDTLRLPAEVLATNLVGSAEAGVEAAGDVLRDYWEAELRTGSGEPGGAPAPRTYRLARSIRVTKRRSDEGPSVDVGTPIFYGRILHFGVPGRIAPRPHGELALNAAEGAMNDAFAKAMR